MSIQLTQADFTALAAEDSAYLNRKGADLYAAEDYERAIEYYRLAAAMGNWQSASNLGYCYMYARSIPQNMSLALAYFRLAASHRCIDALYKLSDIYHRGADGIEADAELSFYYLKQGEDAFYYWMREDHADPMDFPSLFFRLGEEYMPGGGLDEDLSRAFGALQTAVLGFERELEQGIFYHRKALDEARALLDEPCFDELREEAEADDDDDDESGCLSF